VLAEGVRTDPRVECKLCSRLLKRMATRAALERFKFPPVG